MNSLSIFITLDQDNHKELDNILSTFFQTNTHSSYELFVLDQTDDPGSVLKTVADYSSKGFIRRIRTPNSSLTHKVRYSKCANIKTLDDVHQLAKGVFPVFDTAQLPDKLSLPKTTDQGILAQSKQAQESSLGDFTDGLSLEELKQENELLLHQLHQVQEQLEEYYLKYQELKNSTETVNG